MTLSEQGLHDLLERGQQIADLAGTIGWNMLTDRAAVDIGKKQQQILSGGLSLEDYQRAVAWVAGAQHVLELPAILDRQIESYRDALKNATGEEGE